MYEKQIQIQLVLFVYLPPQSMCMSKLWNLHDIQDFVGFIYGK